jgi:hypothetical protein
MDVVTDDEVVEGTAIAQTEEFAETPVVSRLVLQKM